MHKEYFPYKSLLPIIMYGKFMQTMLPTKQYWDQIITPYTESSNIKSLWQLFETLVIFSGVCYAMYLTVESYYILTLILSLIGGLLVVKLFVLQHDCGHGSFFKDERANKIIGRMLSVLTLTPFAQWTKEHKRHHATCGNLDNRGIGDVYTFTVKEYANFSPLGKSATEFIVTLYFYLRLVHFIILL